MINNGKLWMASNIATILQNHRWTIISYDEVRIFAEGGSIYILMGTHFSEFLWFSNNR